ncbi:MAG TPA: AsmA-like C-terminal domain-containing protein [Nitrospira sp.]|nr:AsmA-like C-terminal domain-containing protein [Nitrospira sp.]
MPGMNPTIDTPPRRGTGRLLLLILLGLAICCVGALFALPWLLNRPASMAAVLQEFEERTGFRLSTGQSHVQIFPSPRLTLTEPRLYGAASTTPLVLAERLELALQWLPLLDGRMVAKDLVIDRPRVTLRRSPNGNWALGNEHSPAAASESPAPFALLQVVRNLFVVQGMITLVDASATPATSLNIILTEAALSSDMLGRRAKLHLSGELPQAGGRATFLWDGSVTQSGEEEGMQAEGDLRLHQLNVRQALSSWMGDGRITDGFSQPAQLMVHLRWKPGAAGYDLLADDVRAELADVSLQGTGAILGIGTAQARFSSTLSAPPVTAARLLNEVPSTWMPAELRAQFVDHAVEGLITLQSLSIAGDIVTGARPRINGLLAIRNGRFTLSSQYPPVEALTVSIAFDADHLRMTEVRAQCGPVRLAGRDLLITQWATDPHIDVNITGTAPVAGLVETVRRLDDFPLLRDLVTGVEQPTGDVEMVAHVRGRPLSGQPLALVDADLRLQRGGGRSASLPMPVRQVEAHVTVTPTVVAIEHLDGWLGPAAFQTHGSVTMADGKAYSNVTLAMSMEASELQSWWTQQAGEELVPEMDGTIRLHAAMTGAIGHPRIKGSIDLAQAGVRVRNWVTKPLQAPAAIDFEGQFSRDHRLVIRHVGIKFPPVTVTASGTIELDGEREFSAHVSSGRIAVARLPKGIVLGPVRAGTLEATLDMEGRMTDRASWRTSGQIRFDDGTIKVEDVDEPIRDAFVTLHFDRDRIHIPRMAFHVGASDLRISGSIAQWADHPKARLVVESSQIDLAAFELSRPRSSAARQRSSNHLWTDTTLHAFLFADHVYYKKFLLTDLSTKITWDHGLLTVERISGDTNEGQLAGQVKLRTKNGQMEQARGTFRASGIPVERVLSPFQEKPALSGWLTASGKVHAKFERGVLLPAGLTSRQPVQILIEEGRMHHVPVLSTLLSVLNLPAVLQGQVNLEQEGMPFDRLKLAGSINNGVVNTKEFLLDSPVLKISGTGRYDMLADEFDMVLATSPLGSYSAILKRIPLFGHLLSGDRQGFDTAVFELKGSADKPQLRYLPAESLMTGVKGTAQLAFDILVNAITLPQKAFSLVEEGVTGGEEGEF